MTRNVMLSFLQNLTTSKKQQQQQQQQQPTDSTLFGVTKSPPASANGVKTICDTENKDRNSFKAATVNGKIKKKTRLKSYFFPHRSR